MSRQTALPAAVAFIAAFALISGSFSAPSPRLATDPPRLALVGHIGGLAHAAAWSGDLLCAGIGPRLTVYDISDLDMPIFTGQSDVLWGLIRAVVIQGERAYLAADQAGQLVLSLADPTHPVLIGSYEEAAPAFGLAVAGDLAYIAAGKTACVSSM